MSQWLVRTLENQILGPFDQDHLVKLIHEGDLSPRDEVCAANEYWFYLHEQEEILKFFDQKTLEIIQRKSEEEMDPDEEETYTDTKRLGQTKLTDITKSPDAPIPELPSYESSPEDDAALERNQALRKFQKKKSNVKIVHLPHTLGQMDKSSVWFILILTLIGAILLTVITLIQLLKN